MEFVRLSDEDGSWQSFLSDWEAQCERLDEDFESYLFSAIDIVKDLAAPPLQTHSGVYAIKDADGVFLLMCQLNAAHLPGYTGRVLRVRQLCFAPMYDVGELDLEHYAQALVALFYEIVTLSKKDMPAAHIKFHLRSPNDRLFFTALGSALMRSGEFSSVVMRGAWLYISKANP